MTDKVRHNSRPAKAEDIREFFGQDSPHTVRARVWEYDGHLAAIAGYYIVSGIAVVFSDIKTDAPKIRIWREALEMMKSINLPAICMADDNSGPFLERLGWVRVDGSEGVYRWHHC